MGEVYRAPEAESTWAARVWDVAALTTFAAILTVAASGLFRRE